MQKTTLQARAGASRPAGPLPAARGWGDAPHPGVMRAPSGGSPLPAPVQRKMEGALGQDFSGVRVHQGPEAESIGADAYTRGEHIHFRPGLYSPGSPSGQRLLGHELTHVVQQRAGRVPVPAGGGVPVNADPGLEGEADRLGARAAAAPAPQAAPPAPAAAGSASAPVQRSASAPIQRVRGKPKTGKNDPHINQRQKEIATEKFEANKNTDTSKMSKDELKKFKRQQKHLNLKATQKGETHHTQN